MGVARVEGCEVWGVARDVEIDFEGSCLYASKTKRVLFVRNSELNISCSSRFKILRAIQAPKLKVFAIIHVSLSPCRHAG